jgi:hypothetical protein
MLTLIFSYGNDASVHSLGEAMLMQFLIQVAHFQGVLSYMAQGHDRLRSRRYAHFAFVMEQSIMAIADSITIRHGI